MVNDTADFLDAGILVDPGQYTVGSDTQMDDLSFGVWEDVSTDPAAPATAATGSAVVGSKGKSLMKKGKDSSNNKKCCHNMRATRCRICMGVEICEHKKRKVDCEDCGGKGICRHGQRRRSCLLCKHNVGADPDNPLIFRLRLSLVNKCGKLTGLKQPMRIKFRLSRIRRVYKLSDAFLCRFKPTRTRRV